MRVKLKHPIRHNKNEFSAGACIDMSDAEGQRLIRKGLALAVAGEPVGNGNPETFETKPQETEPVSVESTRDIEVMSRDEIISELGLLGIPYDSNSTTKKLREVLKGSKG